MASTPGKIDWPATSHQDSEAPEGGVQLSPSQMIIESVLPLEKDEHKRNL